MTIGDKPALQQVESSPLPAQREQVGRAARKKSLTREIVETILLTLVIFLLVRVLVQNFKVDGSSMEPSLHNGQYLLVNEAVYFRFDTNRLKRLFRQDAPGQHIVYLFHSPRRGEVVVFRFPRNPSRDFIKRVIGVAGDTVEIRGGTVYVNGNALRESYIEDTPDYDFPPSVVPEGNVFVLGDNRRNSSDSHAWGPVPLSNIVGKAWFTYWPISSWGLVPHVEYQP